MKCSFHTPNGLHISSINKGLARLLFKSNFKTIRLGFETADLRRQECTGGKVANQQFEEAIANLCQAGYRKEEIGVYVMCGLPGQSEGEVAQTIGYAASLGVKVKLVEYSPIPGTVEWKRAVEEFGLDLSPDPLAHNNSILPFLSRSSYERLKMLCLSKQDLSRKI